MKYFTGTLLIEEHVARREHFIPVLIAANDDKAAQVFLQKTASDWDGDGGSKEIELEGRAAYRYSIGDQPYTIRPFHTEEISPAAYFGMKGLRRIGSDVSIDLAAQEAPEQTKTLARRLTAQFEAMGDDAKGLSYAKVLNAVAASLGETDWQVLKHKGVEAQGTKPSAASEAPVDGTVVLKMGIATHHHRHGEDNFLFQDLPSRRQAIARVRQSSDYNPEDGQSLDINTIDVTVDAKWLGQQLSRVVPAAPSDDAPAEAMVDLEEPTKIHLTIDTTSKTWYWSLTPVPAEFNRDLSRQDFRGGAQGDDWDGPFLGVEDLIDSIKGARPDFPFEIEWAAPVDPLKIVNGRNFFDVMQDGGEYLESVASLESAKSTAKGMCDAGAEGVWTVQADDGAVKAVFAANWVEKPKKKMRP